MYLVDTNVWLERLLEQEHSDDVGKLLNQVPSDQLVMSDFSFHSICVILARLRRTPTLVDFVKDVFIEGAVGIVSVRPEDTTSVTSAMDGFKLDFDDAYQYIAAEQNNLIIISFDGDFDRTARGKKTPAEALSTV
jgi:predicted nucleic acid-binding protein